VSEQQVWPSRELADAVLADLAVVQAEVQAGVHAARGEVNKPVQQALLTVAWRLDELREQLLDRLGVPAAVPATFAGAEPQGVHEPGQVTADVVRRMRKNSGGQHRVKP
jgi:hypothetical protein